MEEGRASPRQTSTSLSKITLFLFRFPFSFPFFHGALSCDARACTYSYETYRCTRTVRVFQPACVELLSSTSRRETQVVAPLREPTTTPPEIYDVSVIVYLCKRVSHTERIPRSAGWSPPRKERSLLGNFTGGATTTQTKEGGGGIMAWSQSLRARLAQQNKPANKRTCRGLHKDITISNVRYHTPLRK